jgi:hypothetical protein
VFAEQRDSPFAAVKSGCDVSPDNDLRGSGRWCTQGPSALDGENTVNQLSLRGVCVQHRNPPFRFEQRQRIGIAANDLLQREPFLILSTQ